MVDSVFREIQTMLEVCQSETDHLTDWEQSFIESVSDDFDRKGELSTKQYNLLKRLYDKVA